MLQAQEAGANGAVPRRPSVLLVDDSDAVRSSLGLVLEHNGFTVVGAANVREALQLIATRSFDVLLSDLHMPHAGDGLTVVSAMRHSNPSAVTLIFSGYPGMREAASAILMQADEILVKPLAVNMLVDTIRERMKRGRGPRRLVESVATIIEQETQNTITEWLMRVDREPSITAVRLDYAERSAHLPQLFRDIVARLRDPSPLGTRAARSAAAVEHGLRRREQGYSASMMVEESRMLQVTIFQTLQDNLHKVDFSQVLVGVMAIADEVDSQLAQSMASYTSGSSRMDVAC
jgi:DNA-binding response OmpR family regulator